MHAVRERALPRPVDRYLAELRRRALVVHGARAGAAALGAAAATFVLLALFVGPVVGPWTAAFAWLAVLAAGSMTAWAVLRSAPRLAQRRAADLLADVRLDLVSAARSAVELSHDDRARRLAPALVEAHAAQVREALSELPPERVVPWRKLRDPVFVGGVGALWVCALVLAIDGRAATGTWALAHPGAEDRGEPVAAVVAKVDARLVFPAYLGADAQRVRDVATLQVPRGTAVELEVTARVDATQGRVTLGASTVRLTRDSRGKLVGRFVARTDCLIVVRVRDSSGRWLRDPTPRTLRIAPDLAPRVALVAPERDTTIEPGAELPVMFEARDDVGIVAVELVVKTADGREVRRRLETIPGDDRRTSLGGMTTLVPAALGARPGDRLAIRVEARDGDDVGGPNVGRSPERIVTIASDTMRHAENVADLKEALDRTIEVLAARLENPVPDVGSRAKQRFDLLRGATDTLANALEALTERLGRDRRARTSDAGVFGAMANRLRRALASESRAHGEPVAQASRRTEIDAKAVEELERDVILLADLLGRARIEDAAAITRELEALRRQMVSLVDELRRSSSEQAKRDLLAQIARAQARMRELAARLAQMTNDVPSDFVNQEALPEAAAEDALAAMQAAVERGDAAEAARQLARLQRQIDSIAQALGQTQGEFAAARFGARDRALAEALDQLVDLETEQRALAQRSGDARSRAAERAARAQSASSETIRQLSERVRDARSAVGRVPPRDPDSPTGESLGRARQRLDDAADALGTGDLGEARRMAERAANDMDEAARDLTLDAEMFPGATGRTAADARAARDATARLRELERAVEEATPRASQFVSDDDRRQLRGDAPRQRLARAAADRLAERFATGPEGAPLSPESEQAVRQASEAMSEAGHSLERGDPRESARAQEDAARRLSELREQLEHQGRQQQGSRGGSGDEEGAEMEGEVDFHQPVRIPGAEEFRGPMEQRRQVLDAMRESAPSGFEAAVRRYYEALLR